MKLQKVVNEKTLEFMDHDFEIMLKALKSVPVRYIKMEHYNEKVETYLSKIKGNDCPTIKEILHEQLERIFAYEFYHQWRCLLCLESSELVLNAEQEKLLLEDTLKFPDMVLHRGQDNNDNQKIVCEIKRKSGMRDCKKDFNTLCRCMRTLGFEYGVFIALNEDSESLIKNIKKYDFKDILKDENDSKNLFFVLVNVEDNTTIVRYLSLRGIINDDKFITY